VDVAILRALMVGVNRGKIDVHKASARNFFALLLSLAERTVEDRPKLTQRFHHRLFHP